jgi:outer membrane beta-barrel protein
MRQELALPLIALAAAAAPLFASAQTAGQQPANEQVVVPQVERRELKLPKFPSKDIEVGLLAGVYGTQDFGSHVVAGLRLGYHISEDIFVEGVYARTKASDESFRQILPSGIFPTVTVPLTYYNLSAGYNVLPGEVFLGTRYAKATAVYLIAGVGATKLNGQRHQTFNFGTGLRLLLTDRIALQVDLRDHVFSMDLLGKRKSMNNLEMTGGVTIFF